MKVIQTAVYEGPNIYAPVPVIRWRIDLEGLEEWPTGRLGAAFTDALLDRLPGLGGHGASEGAPGDFARAMVEKDGVSLGQVLAHTVLDLQRLAGADIEFAEALPAGAPGVYDVLYGYEEAEAGIAAGQLALALIGHLLPSELRPEAGVSPGFDFGRARDTFIRFARQRFFNMFMAPLVKAAEERGIPWTRVGRHAGMLQLGHGRFCQRLAETMTGDASYVASLISREKPLTTRILGDLGLPVPRQRVVASEQQAVRAADQIGYPVVVKPTNTYSGHGVSIRMADAQAVSAAYKHAREHGDSVIVESFIEGDVYRLLVVGGELIAAAKRVPAQVIGDGAQTIEELVEELNRDPRRGPEDWRNPRSRLEFDERVERILAEAGYTRETVPEKGETVRLRYLPLQTDGGTNIDMTDRVHPDNRVMAVRATEAIGLVTSGIDFIIPDISRSYKDVGGAICEVNCAPSLPLHLAAEGEPRDVAGPIIETLYAPGTTGRIPIAAVTGGPGATAAASMLAHVLQTAGQTVGLATREGLAIDGDALVRGDRSGPAGARSVLYNPSVDAAVLETSPEGVLRRGLGFDICDVAAVLDAAFAPGNPDSAAPIEMRTKAMEVVVRAARGAVVLDVDDELCRTMADQAEAGHVCYVTRDSGHSGLDEHLAAGGRAVVLEKGEGGGTITVRDGDGRTAVVETDRIPALRDADAGYDTRSAMFAAAMAHALGKTADEIREGLCTFEPALPPASATNGAGVFVPDATR
ncbi:MAG: acetate--CoA ligase family protein [Kiloniellales bacterium]